MAGIGNTVAVSSPGREIGACFNGFCTAFYGCPYLIIFQVVATLGGLEWFAGLARGIKLGDPPFNGTVIGGAVISIVYLCVLWALFKNKEKVTKRLSKLRDDQTDYWCYYQLLRAIGVVGVLRLFCFISEVLEHKRGLNGFSVGFFLCSYMHIVSLTKVFTMKDLVCLSDSILAVGVTVLARLDHDEKKWTPGLIAQVVVSYFLALLFVYFRFSHVPYGHDVVAVVVV